MNLEDVLEIVAIDEMPGDAGPLAFVAFVRNIPAGEGKFAFVIHPPQTEEPVAARLPLEVKIPAAIATRQIAVQMRVPSFPVAQPGWYHLVLEWEGKPIAENRFAIGQRSAGRARDDESDGEDA